jgi:hypothetical protein
MSGQQNKLTLSPLKNGTRFNLPVKGQLSDLA